MIGGIGYYFNSAGAVSSKAGIDVSYHNGDIDWNQVKAAGIDFAMIRVGVRGYGTDPGSGQVVIDEKFTQNIQGAQAAGLEVGVYFFTQAISVEEGKKEADFVINALRPYSNVKLVAFDTELAYPNTPGEVCRGNTIDRTLRTDIAITFCETVKAAGYTPIIYANASWFQNDLELNRLDGYQKWLARWLASDGQLAWNKPFSMWQFCSDGSVPGINGRVDRNAWKIG